MLRTRRLSRSWGNCCHSCKIAVLNSSIFWHFGLHWLIFLVWLIFAAPYQTNRKWNLKLYTKKVSFRSKNRSITCFTGKYVCTGNENSKPIWNKFIIRIDIIETSQAVLNFCRTVYIVGYLQKIMNRYSTVTVTILYFRHKTIASKTFNYYQWFFIRFCDKSTTWTTSFHLT